MKASLPSIFWAFLVTGATAFGGGTVAHLRERLVRDRKWLDDREFLEVLEISQMLPGIIATNVSVLVGDRMGGFPGAVAAGVGMILPGALTVFLLGMLVTDPGMALKMAPMLKGVAAAAVGLTGAVCFQIGKKQVKAPGDLTLLALTTFLAAWLRVPLPWLVITIAPLSVWLHRPGAKDPPK